MEEVKKTRKKPTTQKNVQVAVDATAEELEKTTPEVAEVVESGAEQPTAEKPAKKKTTNQSAKTSSSKKKSEPAAQKADEPDSVKEPESDVLDNDEPKAAEQSDNAVEELKTDEQSDNVVQPNQEPDENSVEQSTEEQAQTEAEPKTIATKKKKIVSNADGKKPALSKNMIIILSCVLVAVIVAIVLAVTLTSCNSGSKIKKFTVTFDTMGGSEIQSYTLNEGDKIKRPATNPTKDMFTFDDWYWENPNKPGEKQKFVFDTAISQNITLIAGWRGDTSVKIEFNANGGAFENDKEVVLYGLIGSTIAAPADVPTRYGYKFDGWYVDEECYNLFSFGTFPTSNATLYAGWGSDPEFGYVSYYGNGELLRTEPVKKTENVVIPDLFNDSDIVVGDWYTNAEMTKPYTADKPTDALALYTTYYTMGLTFNKGVVTGYNGTATSVVVPSKYNGTTISSIGDDAFYWTKGLTAITSVKLPDTIHTIGSGAFYNCQYLASINLTEKVTTIGADAFYRNERLRTLGDISGLETIGDYAFNGCKELRDFEFGNLLRVIGNYAFNDCVSLTEVTLTYSVQWVGDYAFSGCTSLKTVVAETLVLESIGENAFADCENLTEITLQKTSEAVEFIGNPITDSRNATIYVPSALLDAYKENNAQFKDKFAAIR